MREFHYAVTYNMPGYLPESDPYPVFASGCRDLAEAVRDALAFYGIPPRAIRQVPLRRLWRHLKRHGASTAHFSIQHGPYTLNFDGLTEDEANGFIHSRM